MFPIPNPCFSKNLISKRIAYNNKNIINLRIFGVFDEFENETRFIKANITRLLNDKDILIHKDKYMDYIYMEDLLVTIDYLINNKIDVKDINMVYKNKIKLTEIGKILCNKLNKNFNCKYIYEDFDYTGDGHNLESLNLNLLGLEEGINRTINNIIK